MKNTKWKDVRELPASGKRGWMGGAYTIAFVYSNKGNFIVKGYMREIDEYLSKLKDKGYKYIVNRTLWSRNDWTGEKQFRDIWSTSGNSTYISEPDYKSKDKRFKKFKWRIYRYSREDSNIESEIILKRFPKRWIPEFDKVII